MCSGEAVKINILRDEKGRAARVVVHLTSSATAAQLEEAFGFNFDCLSDISGCSDAYKLLPTLQRVAAHDGLRRYVPAHMP